MMNSVLQSAAAMRPTRTSTANSEGTGQKRREGCHGVLCEAKGCPFFFSSRRRHTRCGRDCSSDVCSSDLEPYNIFSYTFACMAFGQLSLATKNNEYSEIAIKTFQKILTKRENPKGKWNKAYPGTRQLKSFSLPMILSNLTLEIEHLLDKETIERTMEECIHEVMGVFLRPELGGIIVENLNADGTLSDTFDGRLVNPGHGLESMWFIMDLDVRLNRKDLIEKAVKTTLTLMEYGWDKKYGGIFYFMDRKGFPPQQLEWDQKLWWVHIEALIALLKGYQLTGSEECIAWFEKLHEYTWNHFKDSEHPEWWGYLNREGKVLLDLKGGKWKGCFHVPRGLFQCWKTLEQINKQ